MRQKKSEGGKVRSLLFRASEGEVASKLRLRNTKGAMSSFSDDEDMAGYSDDDYGMSSDGDQSYGEVEEAPAASKVREVRAPSHCFFPSVSLFQCFFPSRLSTSNSCFAFPVLSVALLSLIRRRRPRQRDRARSHRVSRRKKRETRATGRGTLSFLFFFARLPPPPPPLRRRPRRGSLKTSTFSISAHLPPTQSASKKNRRLHSPPE